MTPKGATACPSFISMPGMIVCIGRFPGPTLFGWPPSVRNDRPRLCSSTPLSVSVPLSFSLKATGYLGLGGSWNKLGSIKVYDNGKKFCVKDSGTELCI